MNATPAIESQATILAESVDELARGIVFSAEEIRAWLDQPETQAKYQKWLAERRQRRADAV